MQLSDPSAMQGRAVYGTDGKLGKVEGIYLDSETGNAEWATVATGLFGSHVSFVPLATAGTTADGDLQVPFDKDAVKQAPHHEPDEQLSTDDERRLFEHYGVPYGGDTVTAQTGDRDPGAASSAAAGAGTDAGAAGANAGAAGTAGMAGRG